MSGKEAAKFVSVPSYLDIKLITSSIETTHGFDAPLLNPSKHLKQLLNRRTAVVIKALPIELDKKFY
ncbi:MAG: hypothetical protein PHC94_14140 [Methylobacter sp.]|nr:hypothetical protein [Methylobacter sp.]